MVVEKREISLTVKNVGIYYQTYIESDQSAPNTSAVGGHFGQIGNKTVLFALKDINFKLTNGQRLALIGGNGAGKTTLLKVLAGILHPQFGQVETVGQIGNALNINIGFRQELSGRRNIILKGIIGGKKKAELPKLIEDVEQFAELGDFLNAPLRTYSAGMRARIAFGIATSFRHDILLLDEWLGAGDANMRVRTSQRMQEFVGNSAILIIASHNEALIRDTCTHGLVLNHGKIAFFGELDEALEIHNEMQRMDKAT